VERSKKVMRRGVCVLGLAVAAMLANHAEGMRDNFVIATATEREKNLPRVEILDEEESSPEFVSYEPAF
jgi:hypothetical protein